MNNRTRPRSRYPSMALLPRVIAHDLEGSRCGVYQTNPRYSFQRSVRPLNVATGGSREIPSVMHLPLAFGFVYVRPIEQRSAGSFPGAACCRTVRPGSWWNEFARATRHAPKRLPSRRWAISTVTTCHPRGRERRRGRFCLCKYLLEKRAHRCP